MTCLPSHNNLLNHIDLLLLREVEVLLWAAFDKLEEARTVVALLLVPAARVVRAFTDQGDARVIVALLLVQLTRNGAGEQPSDTYAVVALFLVPTTFNRHGSGLRGSGM